MIFFLTGMVHDFGTPCIISSASWYLLQLAYFLGANGPWGSQCARRNETNQLAYFLILQYFISLVTPFPTSRSPVSRSSNALNYIKINVDIDIKFALNNALFLSKCRENVKLGVVEEKGWETPPGRQFLLRPPDRLLHFQLGLWHQSLFPFLVIHGPKEWHKNIASLFFELYQHLFLSFLNKFK